MIVNINKEQMIVNINKEQMIVNIKSVLTTFSHTKLK